jgi:hypothetical protein
VWKTPSIILNMVWPEKSGNSVSWNDILKRKNQNRRKTVIPTPSPHKELKEKSNPTLDPNRPNLSRGQLFRKYGQKLKNKLKESTPGMDTKHEEGMTFMFCDEIFSRSNVMQKKWA